MAYNRYNKRKKGFVLSLNRRVDSNGSTYYVGFYKRTQTFFRVYVNGKTKEGKNWVQKKRLKNGSRAGQEVEMLKLIIEPKFGGGAKFINLFQTREKHLYSGSGYLFSKYNRNGKGDGWLMIE